MKNGPTWGRLESGGGGRNRTGVDGFAGRCITTLLPRQGEPHCTREGRFLRRAAFKQRHHVHERKREALWASLRNLEREKSLELSTSTLARLRSTN